MAAMHYLDMNPSDLIVDLEKTGVKFKQPRPIKEGNAVVDDFSWDDVAVVRINEIQDIVDLNDSSDPFPIQIHNCNVIISIEGGDELQISEENYWTDLYEETEVKYKPSGSVEFTGSKSQNDHFEEFVEFMFEGNFLGEDGFPYKMPNARKNFILNDSKQTLSDDDEIMEHAKRINVNGGVYYNPKDPGGQKKEHIANLIKKSGAWK